MAFQAPNAGQERQNRKILEQLEEQKKRLRIQAQGATQTPTANSTNTPVPQSQNSLTDTHHMTPAQKTALQHAQANSVGYFITQDSSFGNLILPVLPRFEK